MNEEGKKMIFYDAARRLFTVIFLILLGTYFAANSMNQGSRLLGDFADAFRNSKNLSELRSNIAYFDGHIVDTILGRNLFVDGYAYIQVIMGKEETDNFWVIRDKRGGLNYSNFYPDDASIIEECARRVWRLKTTVEEKGTKLFFVNPPSMYVRDKNQYSPGLPYADHNFLQDAFLYQLQRFGIDYIDLRNSLAKHSEISPDNYFFLTDHHWTVETSFAAFSDIVTWMEKTYQTEFDPGFFYRDIHNYNIKYYPQSFLGSLGRGTGANYSGLDDFTVIWPKFDAETDFTLEASFLESQIPDFKRGRYTEALMFPEVFGIQDPYKVDLYAIYQGGIKPFEKITNHNNPQGPKVLMIRDSYTLPVGVFMAPLFSELHMIWHTNEYVQIDIESYLKEHSFDYIIVEVYQGNFYLESFYYFPEPLVNNALENDALEKE